MKWFRFYMEVIDDYKVQSLPGELFKAWVNILCLASKTNGILPPVKDIAFALRKDVKAVNLILSELRSYELLDEVDSHLEPHNWKQRQYQSDSSTDRVRRYRESKQTVTIPESNAECNVSHTVTVTPPDTDDRHRTENRRQTTDYMPQKNGRIESVSLSVPPDFIEETLRAHPHWRKTYEKVVTRGDHPTSYGVGILQRWLQGDGTPPQPKTPKYYEGT